jgi:outer membrane protein OmpA-like peptidoglycan-associated protein
MPSDITFDIDRDAIKPGFRQTLNSVALVLNRYQQTVVDIFGHTDSTGGNAHNMDLSQRRALSVATYLSQQGVDSRRFAVTGFGPSRPIATNDTAEGRALNRRVEIQLSPLT